MRIAALIIFGCLILSASARELSVQIREGQLRAAPSFLSQIREIVPYTERVKVLAEQGDWMQVQPLASETKGWMHQSALTRKKLALAAGEREAAQTVTTSEQALAGKGFNPQVEAEFRSRNAEAAFQWVDKMEQRKVLPGAIQTFLREGGLAPETDKEKK